MHASKLIGVLVVLAALSARADDGKEQARRDVGAALAAQNAGRYDEAIALYKRAYAAIPHPEILFDLGQAHRLKGDAETALSYYRRYLAAEPNGRAAPDATRWVAELSKALADRKREPPRKAEPERKADAHGAAADRRTDPRSAAPDRPADAVRSSGEARPTEAAPRATPPGAPAVPPAADPSTARVAPAGAGAPTSAPAGVATVQLATDPSRSRYRTPAWISAAGGAGAVIGGLVFGGLARSKQSDALAICGPDRVCDSDGDTRRANALLAQSRTRGTASTALIVVGAAGLATSGVLWWLGRRDDSPRAVVAPVATPGGLGVALGGAF